MRLKGRGPGAGGEASRKTAFLASGPWPLLFRLASLLLWASAAVLVTLLGLRFGMRLVGVRPDVPFPGFVYSLTAPLVAPFYSFFPASDRFDYSAVEIASLAAAGSVLAVALVVYVLGLLAVLGAFRLLSTR